MLRAADILEVFITTAVVSLLLTPLMRVVALKMGYLDYPQNNKRHAHSTPLLGGVAIFIAFFIGILSQWDVVMLSQKSQILAILSGTSILLVLGLIDDKMGMGPNIKLLGQFLAAMILYKSGLRLSFFGNYYLNLIFTYLWVIGMTNSFNLLDNMNGLSAGISVIALFFFGAISWINNQTVVVIVSFCLCGSCAGFLKYNFPRAEVFMGDSGSLVIGFILSAIAMLGNWKSNGLLTSIAIPLLVLAYPIFDTTLVTIIRILEHRSIFQGGKDHSSHRLALLGLKTKNTVLFIYVICTILGISALIVSRASFKTGLIIIFIIAVSLFLLGIRLSYVGSGKFGRKRLNNGE